MKNNENHITIKIVGFSCSPDELSHRVNLKATRTAIKGQQYQTGSKSHKVTKKYAHNYWEFRETTYETTWISESVTKFLNKFIAPRKDELKEIISTCEAELSITQYVYEGCNPGLHFQKEEIELLGYIGLEIDIDLYCLADD
jgi:Domain of unknown function (DUF4279)